MNRQNGNVFFIILIAVGLFAALCYAVTSSSRNTGSSATSEGASAKAAALLDYMAGIDGAIMRMRSSGVADNEINFYYLGGHYAVWGGYDNVNCTLPSCRVFDPSGGGVPVLDTKYYKGSGKSGQKNIAYVRFPQTGSDNAEMVFEINGVDYDVCMAINGKAGLPMRFNQAGVWFSPSGLLVYQTAFPVGDIPSFASDANIPASYPQARAYCSCQYADEAACRANASNPMFVYVLLVR